MSAKLALAAPLWLTKCPSLHAQHQLEDHGGERGTPGGSGAGCGGCRAACGRGLSRERADSLCTATAVSMISSMIFSLTYECTPAHALHQCQCSACSSRTAAPACLSMLTQNIFSESLRNVHATTNWRHGPTYESVSLTSVPLVGVQAACLRRVSARCAVLQQLRGLPRPGGRWGRAPAPAGGRGAASGPHGCRRRLRRA